MRRSIGLVWICGALALASTASAQSTDPAPPACPHGQHGRGGPRGAEGRADFLAHSLGLDANQTQLVHEIMESTRGERERIRAMSRGSAEQIAALHALDESVHARIDAVLDETQRAQLARMRAWREAHRGQGRGRHGHRCNRQGGRGQGAGCRIRDRPRLRPDFDIRSGSLRRSR